MGRPLTEHEQRDLLWVARSNSRDHLLILLGLETGLRLGELVALRVGDVKGQSEVTVPNIKGGGVAQVPLTLLAQTTIHCYLFPTRLAIFGDGDHSRCGPQCRIQRGLHPLAPLAPLFLSRGGGRRGQKGGGPLSARAAQSRLSFWKRKIGLGEDITFHSLRHSFLARVWGKAADIHGVQAAARHKQPMVTASHYTYSQPPTPVELQRLVESSSLGDVI
jgi:integrase